eukprot:3932183-Rhodomonas_salina.2
MTGPVGRKWSKVKDLKPCTPIGSNVAASVPGYELPKTSADVRVFYYTTLVVIGGIVVLAAQNKAKNRMRAHQSAMSRRTVSRPTSTTHDPRKPNRRITLTPSNFYPPNHI